MGDVERKISGSRAHDRHQCDDHGGGTWNTDADDAFRSPDSPRHKQLRECFRTGIEFAVGQPGVVGIHRDAFGVEPESPVKNGGIRQHQESFAQGRAIRAADATPSEHSERDGSRGQTEERESIALIKEAGRMSVQWASTHSIAAFCFIGPAILTHPEGISAKTGHSECWFSALTRTRKSAS